MVEMVEMVEMVGDSGGGGSSGSLQARSLSNVKFASAFVSQELSNAIFRRGYAATAAQSSSGKGRAVVSAVMKKGVEESNKKISWIPDPKTGYYRPETGSNEIDPAELRAALLNKKQ